MEKTAHNQEPIDLADKKESNSSIFDKTHPDLRRSINQAIIDRDPPTYKGVYARFKLADRNISFHAFYRYARRVRSHAAMFEMAEMTATAGKDLPAMLPKVLAQRLLEVLAFEDVSPRHIQRLTDAYKTAVKTHVTIRQHRLFTDNKTDTDPCDNIDDLLKQYREVVAREVAKP